MQEFSRMKKLLLAVALLVPAVTHAQAPKPAGPRAIGGEMVLFHDGHNKIAAGLVSPMWFKMDMKKAVLGVSVGVVAWKDYGVKGLRGVDANNQNLGTVAPILRLEGKGPRSWNLAYTSLNIAGKDVKFYGIGTRF
jgi:hypothetical protein